ncbi:response regulator transcription factor [Gorillibacterium massiliense]|uniref:response regulator transcription factor n=1 Tax=Gorillibacterium massiliense TaxID=1280390 RepID=UPI0004ACA513|nr:response regulator [Gorillibacterium massiliense]
MYNILIVDDEPLICKGLQNLLESSGLNIQSINTANSGYEALDILRMDEVDLLVTDIQMGSMSGIELMHQAKMLKPWIQTIVISAHETFQYAQMAIRLGAKDYLIKPINSELFLDSVRNVLLKMDKPVSSQEELIPTLREHFHMKEPDAKRTEQLNRALTGQQDGSGAEEAVSAREIGLIGPYFAVLKVDMHLQESLAGKNYKAGDTVLLKYAALNIINELLDEEWTQHAFFSSETQISIILEWNEEKYEETNVNKINQLDMIGRSLHFNIRKFLGMESVVGISQILKGAEFLQVLGRQSQKAISLRKMISENWDNQEHFVFYYGDLSMNPNAQDEEPTEEEMLARNNLIVEKAMDYINENYAQKGLTLHEVAQKTHVSPNYLSYLFKKNTGYNLWEYVIKLRMEESKRLILQTDMRRYEISDQVGYESPEHFSKIFKKYFGISPSELKK